LESQALETPVLKQPRDELEFSLTAMTYGIQTFSPSSGVPLRRHQNAIFAFTNYLSRGPRFTGPVIQVPADGMIIDPIERMLTKPYIHTMSCFAAPVADMKAIGGFNTSLQRFSDLDLYVRLLAGAKSRGALAWKKRPFLVIPHIAVLKEIHLRDRPLESYAVAWEKNKRRFLDEIFSYPFMKRRLSLRKNCEHSLDEGQRQFFANFS
jgi:hypothetical protein